MEPVFIHFFQKFLSCCVQIYSLCLGLRFSGLGLGVGLRVRFSMSTKYNALYCTLVVY